MKKIIWIVIVGALFVTMAGCGDSDNNADIGEPQELLVAPAPEEADEIVELIHEPERCECGISLASDVARAPTPPINIHDLANDEFLDTFDHLHFFEYADWETDWRNRLVIWTDEPVQEMSFVTLGFAHVVSQFYHYTADEHFTISQLAPGEAFVLDVAFAHYLIPGGGLRFVDAMGELRHMMIIESMAGICECWSRFLLQEFYDRTATPPEQRVNSIYPTNHQHDIITQLLGDYRLGEVDEWRGGYPSEQVVYLRRLYYDGEPDSALVRQLRIPWDLNGDFGTSLGDVLLLHVEYFHDTWLMIDEGASACGERRYAVIEFE